MSLKTDERYLNIVIERQERETVMKYRLLGKSGLRVSEAALGTLPAAEVALAYLRAISHPITGRILKLHKTGN